MTVRHHVLDIYDVHLYLATNLDDWKRMRRRLDFIPEQPNADGLSSFATWEPDEGPTVPVLALWVNLATLEPSAVVETCAHEASHAAGQILTWLGHDIRGTDGTDEPHAYLTGWLTRWLWQCCQPTAKTAL